ncbi:phosphatidylserine decarboxylase [Parasphingorhabdus sp.]|uniref:phosphatidylserine decarboxylase n=1 Tax=Parasphingorhabdus sp. TaxID=2709688 RepID=UPI0032645CD0
MAIEKYSNKGLGEAKWSFPPVHPEGRKFAVIAAGITAVFAVMAWETLAWPMAGITIWVLAFFRDPKRVTPLDDKYIVAPADGLVNLIMPVIPPLELQGEGGLGEEEVTRVSIFMSVFDVHINRTPIEGMVKRQAYISGKFLNADLDKASEENERQHFLVERNDGLKVGFTQIAGLVARRIMAFVKEGDYVAAGQRIGLIRFGSRVDVYLPKGTMPNVVLGQRTIAGETIIAVTGEMKEIEGVGQ